MLVVVLLDFGVAHADLSPHLVVDDLLWHRQPDQLFLQVLAGHPLLFEQSLKFFLAWNVLLLAKVVHQVLAHLVEIQEGLRPLHQEQLGDHVRQHRLVRIQKPLIEVRPRVLLVDLLQDVSATLLELALADDPVVHLGDDLLDDGAPGRRGQDEDRHDDREEGASCGTPPSNRRGGRCG